MIWQDLVIMISGIVFCIALMPQIRKNYEQKSVNQISWLYLMIYSLGLVALQIGYMGSKYWLASIFNFINIIQYVIIGIQKKYYEKN